MVSILRPIFTLLLVLGLCAPLLAATPVKKPAPKPAAKKPVAKKPAPKAIVILGKNFTSLDLDRMFVGNQAGILKIFTNDKKGVLFVKDAPNTDMKGIDGTLWAPVTDRHRNEILAALGIPDSELVNVSNNLMKHFSKLKKREAIAVLGLIGSLPDGRLADTQASTISDFLESLLKKEKDVIVRRQATLSLALLDEVDDATVLAVVDFMKSSANAWETFTTKQFFEYHLKYIRSRPSLGTIRERVTASGNPYSEAIAGMLD
jgi:hypothetical protein